MIVVDKIFKKHKFVKITQKGPNVKMVKEDDISKWPKFVKTTQNGQNF